MDKTVSFAKRYGVAVGAHPSLPDRQGSEDVRWLSNRYDDFYYFHLFSQ